MLSEFVFDFHIHSTRLIQSSTRSGGRGWSAVQTAHGTSRYNGITSDGDKKRGYEHQVHGRIQQMEGVQTEGGQEIPAQPIHVSLYISNLIDLGSSVGVIQSAIYAIKWAHNIRALKDPTENQFVKSLLETAKRKNSGPTVKKDVITSDQIIAVCTKYESTQDLLVLRDLAFIVLGFSGFLRFDEIHSLKGNDVNFEENYLTLYLRKSKTDQYRKGKLVTISKGQAAACPLKILRRFHGQG